MKALTVCQPYADLILLPKTDSRFKRVENRTWPTRFRGPLLIHAGKSRDWLCENPRQPGYDDYGFKLDEIVFGAIVGVVDVINSLPADQVEQVYPQLKGHQHINGPWCIVMCNVRRFATPIPYKGAQGLFEVPAEVVAEQMAAVEAK